MRLVAAEETRATVERTHGIYAMHCPLYRTLHNAIRLSSSFELVSAVSSGDYTIRTWGKAQAAGYLGELQFVARRCPTIWR